MIYLDNAATTLKKPDCVIEAVIRAMGTLGNPSRGAHMPSLDASRTVYGARKELARLFNASSASEIAFSSNATEALNTAIFGLFKPGDHIISTVCEHNSVLRPLYLLEQSGACVDYIGADENGVLLYEQAEKLIKPATRAFVISHASNVTGNIADIAFFAKLKQKYGLLLIVDGAQSAGSIPVDVRGQDIDVFCFTGHKALMGPQGTGGLYVKKGIKIRPLKSGGSGIHSYDRLHPQRMPDALEAGTLNCHGIAGLLAASEFINKTGVENIHSYEMKLVKRFYEGLKSLDGVTVYGSFSGDRAPVVSLNIDGFDAARVSDILNTEYDIAVRAGAHCAPMMHKALGTDKKGAVRFSFGYYNTQNEADAALEAIEKIQSCAGSRVKNP